MIKPSITIKNEVRWQLLVPACVLWVRIHSYSHINTHPITHIIKKRGTRN